MDPRGHFAPALIFDRVMEQRGNRFVFTSAVFEHQGIPLALSLDVPAGLETWPVFREGGAAVPGDADTTFVYEGPSSGAGETVNWDRAAALSKGRHMILAGGLDANNVARAIATVRPWGVDVSSGVESAPGEKDTGRIRNFISAARAAEKQ